MARAHKPGGWMNVRRPKDSQPATATATVTAPPEDVGVEAALAETMAIGIRELDDLRQPFKPWSLRVHEPKTGRLDFERFPYQEELYSDEFAYEHDGVVKKGTQVGISTWMIRWILFFPDTKGWTSFYLFPKEKHMHKFSDQRIKPLIERSEYLRGRVPAGHVSNKGLKQVGPLGFANFAGSQNKDEVDSVDADVLGMDEYDRLVQANIPDAEQRVSGSPHGLIRRIGVPTVPRYGVSKLYGASDQRKWMVKCSRCKQGWQEIDFFKNMDMEKAIIVCSRCRKPLDVLKGEWVAAVTDGDRMRGYHISRLIVAHANLREIVKHSKQRKPFEQQRFWNKDLGLEFSSGTGSITDEVLIAAQTKAGGYRMPEGYRGTNPVTMGVDMASVRSASVRISEHLDLENDVKRALFIGEVDDTDLPKFLQKLGDLMLRYNVNMVAIDHLPDGRVARAFANMFPGLVYVVALVGRQNQVIKLDPDVLECSVKRTEALDATISQMRAQRNLLPGKDLDDLPEGYVEQMQSPQRFEEEDEESGERDVGYISTGPDDYALAEVFDSIATELFAMRQGIESYMGAQTSVLDDHMAFERSNLDRYEDEAYAPGTPPEQSGEDEWQTDDEDWPSI